MVFEKEELEFLKRLTESFGPPGFEKEPIKIIKEHVSRFSDEITTDKLGTLIYRKKGLNEQPRVLVAGHVDEVGFIVTNVTKEGFISFTGLGGWFDQVLLAQRVQIKTKKGKIIGVIGVKPPHLLKPEERDKVIKIDKMFIDIGATSKEEVEEMGVRIGDPIIPYSEFTVTMNGKVAMGKAFDDRLGAFIAAQVVKRINNHPNTLYGAATVQEEVGLRGARTAAYKINPDAAIIPEVDISGDAPGIKPEEAPAKMGKGPSIITYDASMIPNQELKEFIIQVAEEERIPYQLSQVKKGGTDAGIIHITGVGCPCIVVGVPTRYIHSHVGVFSLEDLENTVKLIVSAVKRLDRETVENFTKI